MSKRFIGFLTLILLTYGLYSFTTYQELLYVLALLIAIPLASFLLLFIGRYFVNVKVRLEKNRVYRTETFKLFIEIENKSPFYFPLVKIEFNKPRDNFSIKTVKANNNIYATNELKELNRFEEEYFTDLNVPNEEIAAWKGTSYAYRLYKWPHFARSEQLISLALPQNSFVEHSLDLISQNKGVYEVGTDSILLQDLFSFFYLPLPKRKFFNSRAKEYDSVRELEVYPNPRKWSSPEAGKLKEPEQVLMSTDNRKVSNEIDTLANVRDYQRGDRMKQIHWKLSSRTGNWLAREFEDPRQGGVLFVLDPKLPDSCVLPIEYANQATEILAATIRVISKTEGPLNLLLEEKVITSPGEGVEATNFYRHLMFWQAQIKSNDPRLGTNDFKKSCNIVKIRTELSELLRKECKNKIYRAVVICTARMNQALINEMVKIQKAGSQIILIFIHNEKAETLKENLKYLIRSDVRVMPSKINSLLPYAEVAGTTENKAAPRVNINSNIMPKERGKKNV